VDDYGDDYGGRIRNSLRVFRIFVVVAARVKHQEKTMGASSCRCNPLWTKPKRRHKVSSFAFQSWQEARQTVSDMELDIKAAAALMGESEKTVYRWIRDQGLPAHRINEQYHFNRAELLEWATAQGVRVSRAMFAPSEPSATAPAGLAAALAAGGIHYQVAAADKQTALAAAIGFLPVPDDVDRDLLLDIILARESLGSTGLGDGIAIPHVRNPIVMHIPQPLVTLCFLETPVAFDAVDGQPVHTLFTIVCPAIKSHLHLLARLAYALRHPEFAGVIRARAPLATILAAAVVVDHVAPHPPERKAP